MSKLRLAFMGTPDFAARILQTLITQGNEIAAVYCQPPKPAGRGQHLTKSPVQILAEASGLEVRTPKTLRDTGEQKRFEDLNLDIAVVAAYGLLLPLPVLQAPKFGCVNIHASLLPRWRGAAPIQRSILAGDTETGVTIMQMAEGLDTGDMLLFEKVPITSQTTAPLLHDRLAVSGAKLIVQTLDAFSEGKVKATPQPTEGVTYAAKLSREDGRIDWTKSADEIDRQMRALQPWPGCFFMLGDEPIKVHAVSVIDNINGEPGTLLDNAFTVACGQAVVRLLKLQRSGKGVMDGESLLRGLRLEIGYRFI
jgi:methionyl-tRNA formyltransferase